MILVLSSPQPDLTKAEHLQINPEAVPYLWIIKTDDKVTAYINALPDHIPLWRETKSHTK